MKANERPLKRRLRDLINHPYAEVVVMCAIMLSVLLVLYEFSIPTTHPRFQLVELVNRFFTYFFIVELSVRFYVEPRKSRFFRRYWLDILAVLPFFRSFRVLRIFRLLRLFRFGIILYRRLTRWSDKFQSVKAEYIIGGMTILVVILMGAFSMRAVEGRDNADFATLEQALWFAVMTVIGGEPIGGSPKTTFGQFITTILMMGGLTVFAVFTGTISAVMANSLRNLKFGIMEIEDLENHVVVCGWNRAGKLIVDELLHEGHLNRRRNGLFRHIVIISEDPSIKKNPTIQSSVDEIFVIIGDYTRTEVLRSAGIERAHHAILLADSAKERSSQDRDARTVLAAMLIEKINKDIYTIVQLLNRDNETSLRQVGVEEIIVTDEYVGNIMATVAKNRGIVNMLDELLTSKYGHQFFKCGVPRGMVGRTVGEIIGELKVDYDATLIGVDLGKGETIAEIMRVNPPADLVLEESHRIIIAGSKPIDA